MESCRSEPLKFDCNKKIDINPKEYWEEIMQLTFLNDKSEYLSLARLSYEEEVYIEYNDQIYFLYSNVNNIRFRLDNSILTIEVDNPTRGNLPNTFTINIFQPFDNLEYLLNLLFQKWCLCSYDAGVREMAYIQDIPPTDVFFIWRLYYIPPATLIL
mgnify:CR=1 FL=1